MDVSNVVRALLPMAEMPLDADIPFMTAMTDAMPCIGRGRTATRFGHM